MTHLRRSALFVVLGACSGVLAGLASFVFLEGLDRVTELRVDHEWIVWLLPAAGLLVGFTYHLIGGRAVGGTALAVSEAHAYTRGAPARMAPLVLGGTLFGHLFGASVGREGTAVQMSAALTDAGARALRLDHDQRATLARAALAGGFGSVFGVPFAGVVFALEVARRRTFRALLAAAPAAFVGQWVVTSLGQGHTARPRITMPFDASTIARLVVAGVAFGVTARLFALAVPALKSFIARTVVWPPARPAIGGVATVLLMALVGRDYLGLSLPLLDGAFSGAELAWWDPALKLVFTCLALGTGFVGGEVTPLFVIGATLGSVLASPLQLSAAALGAVGLAAVFGAAAHVPIACAVMAVELFGSGIVVPAVLGCVVARAVARGDSIYQHPVMPDAALAPAVRADHVSDPRST
jgi:H+/Cl- antiporter ClcA